MHYLCRWIGCVVLAVGAAAFAGCGGATDELTISAASSMRGVLPQIVGPARINSGGSDTLAVQIIEGAPIDLFVSAGTASTDRLARLGLIERPVTIATNTLIVVVPASNPARIRRVGDLARPGVALVLANPSVPIGDYARRALARLGLSDASANVVSDETSAAGVLAKVRLGEADAGIVYTTDARAAGGDVATVAVPPSAQPPITYTAAVVIGAPHPDRARAALTALRQPRGRRALAEAGFGTPSG